MSRVTVTYDPPPIPGWRALAYTATLASYEPGEPIGRGPTRFAAIRDLAESKRRREESPAHILGDDDLRALYQLPHVTGTHPHAKPAHKPRDWSAE